MSKGSYTRRRVDKNHRAVAEALEGVGCVVLSLAAMGHGVPDLLVLHRGRLKLLEVKDGALPPSERRLTPAQEAFHRAWPVTVVYSPGDAVAKVCQLELMEPA